MKGDLTCKYKLFLKRYNCESPVPLNWFALFDVECVNCIIFKKIIIIIVIMFYIN